MSRHSSWTHTLWQHSLVRNCFESLARLMESYDRKGLKQKDFFQKKFVSFVTQLKQVAKSVRTCKLWRVHVCSVVLDKQTPVHFKWLSEKNIMEHKLCEINGKPFPVCLLPWCQNESLSKTSQYMSFTCTFIFMEIKVILLWKVKTKNRFETGKKLK